jgi:hypothetical protein
MRIEEERRGDEQGGNTDGQQPALSEPLLPIDDAIGRRGSDVESRLNADARCRRVHRWGFCERRFTALGGCDHVPAHGG